jgi:hypothetical protein
MADDPVKPAPQEKSPDIPSEEQDLRTLPPGHPRKVAHMQAMGDAAVEAIIEALNSKD